MGARAQTRPPGAQLPGGRWILMGRSVGTNSLPPPGPCGNGRDAAGATNGHAKLLPQHLADLGRSGLSAETIEANRYYSVTDRETAREILRGTPPDGILPAYAIPYRGPGGYLSGYSRLRPDNPRLDEYG